MRREDTEYYGRREDEASKTAWEKNQPSNPQWRLPCTSSSSSSSLLPPVVACCDLRGTRSGCAPWVVSGVGVVVQGCVTVVRR